MPLHTRKLPRRTLLALLATLPAGCAGACDRTLVARLPLRQVESYPVIEASLAGRPVSLIVDTGAQGMLVTPQTAAALNLPLHGMTRVYGTGGSQEMRVVEMLGLRLGGIPMPPQLAPASPLPVTLAATPPIAGLLGASLLAQFDVMLDVPGNAMLLYTPSDCPAPFPGTTVRMEPSQTGEPLIPVSVQGQPVLALLDTGSRATLLDQAAARRLGLAAPPSANTARGVDGQPLPLEHLHVRLAIGTEPPAEIPISVTPLQLDRGEMLLGFDRLLRRRVWIGYARGEVVFSPPAP